MNSESKSPNGPNGSKVICTPLVKYRISCENKSLYFTVCVWRTLREFRLSNPGNSHALGLCRSHMRMRIYKSRPDRLLPECGELHFAQYHLRIGIITHEFTHAAIEWAARTGVIPDFSKLNRDQHCTLRRHSNEERFCYVLGNMVKEFIRRCYDDGVFNNPPAKKAKQ